MGAVTKRASVDLDRGQTVVPSVASSAQDISLDDHPPEAITAPGSEGPSFVWARVCPEDLAGMRVLEVRNVIPERRASVTTALLRRLVAETLKVVPREVSDDAIVDQRSGLVPPDLYLRLARAKAFPSRKVGKRTLARWGDVRDALLPPTSRPKSNEQPGEPPTADDLRMRWGLAPTGRS